MKFSRGNPKSSRYRCTLATARLKTSEFLIDSYESAKRVLATELEEPGTIAPSDLMKATKERWVCRQILLKRGYKAELLDYEVQPHGNPQSVEESLAL